MKMISGKIKKMVVIAVLLGVSVFAVSIISQRVNEKNQMPVAQSKGISVNVQQVKMMDSLNNSVYKVNLDSFDEVEVSTNTSGRVTNVFFENGANVKRGQILITLDDTNLQSKLKTAELELKKLKIDADAKGKQYKNMEVLYKSGVNTENELEDYKRIYDTARVECELKQVEIQNIHNSIQDCTIKSEIDGGVVEKNINVGQYINPGPTYAKIKNNSYIKAKTQLMQTDLSSLSVGDSVNIGLSESGEKPFKGVVKTISKSANSQTRGFDCIIIIENENGKLNSGISGYMEIPQKDKKNYLVVLASAVVGNQGAYAVFQVKDGKAIQKPIKIGKISNEWIEVVSGLNEGESIIVTNASSLQSGDKVQVSGGNK